MDKDNDPARRAEKKEHVLACLSGSPTAVGLLQTAAKNAEALGAEFTALSVHTPETDRLEPAKREQFRQNVLLAQSLGAKVVTVYGEDVPQQIAEFVKISGVTQIVIGRSAASRRFLRKPNLTEKLIAVLPEVEIYVVPEQFPERFYRDVKTRLFRRMIPNPFDFLIALAILAAATLLGLLFLSFGFTESNIITVYILAVLLTSLFTKGYVPSVFASVSSVVLFNYFFTDPRLSLQAYGAGYPVTFVIMLAASIITGTLASKLKDHAKLSAQAAFRTQVLFDTNRLLQKAGNDEELIDSTAGQLLKLLDRDLIVYLESGGKLTSGRVFCVPGSVSRKLFFRDAEQRAANEAFHTNRRTGASTETPGDAKCLYLPIRLGTEVLGVVGIWIGKNAPDTFESSVVDSILGECALAIENGRNARESQRAALRAKNEQLRADFLRMISHDLRTPLTSISGNAGNLLNNFDKMDPESVHCAFEDIYDDSLWLTGLVENLLSITRLEEGQMRLNLSLYPIDEVIEEAMRHIDRRDHSHRISVNCSSDRLLAQMDAKLIAQVLINLVDNAIKYTPPGSEIRISAEQAGEELFVHVADNGPGIPDDQKERVFEMFFTGDSAIADRRRGLGLGLALCRSIISAHGGRIRLSDCRPRGAVFTFTLPISEVKLDEQALDSGR